MQPIDGLQNDKERLDGLYFIVFISFLICMGPEVFYR